MRFFITLLESGSEAEKSSKSAPSTPTKAKNKKIVKKVKRTPVSAKKEKENKQENDEEITSPEKISAQRLGVALRNLLKLPKGTSCWYINCYYLV